MFFGYFFHAILKRPFRLNKVYDQGSGIPIVLIHGIGAKSKQWQPLIKILGGDGYRVIAYDLLGFGKSPKPKYLKYSVNDHVKSILWNLQKDIDPSQKIIIIGHSMGCIVGTSLAANNPDLVKRLILYQPPLLIDQKDKKIPMENIYGYVANRPALVSSYLRIANKFTDKFSSYYESDSNNDKWIPFERSLKNTIISQNTERELAKLKIPTDIVFGRFDLFVSKVKTRRLTKLNHNLTVHHIAEIHDITIKSAKFLKNIIESV